MSPDEEINKHFREIRRIHCKGKANEYCAVIAFKRKFYDIPVWFQDIRNATELEEPKGIDVVIYTDIGPVLVQIKSCEEKARAFRQAQKQKLRKKEIVVVVILEHFTHADVRRVILSAVRVAYLQMLNDRAKSNGANFIPADIQPLPA